MVSVKKVLIAVLAVVVLILVFAGLFVATAIVAAFYTPPTDFYSCTGTVELGTYEGNPTEQEAIIILQEFLINDHNFTREQLEKLEINNPAFGQAQHYLVYAHLTELRIVEIGAQGAFYVFPENITGIIGDDVAFILEDNKISVLRNYPEPC